MSNGEAIRFREAQLGMLKGIWSWRHQALQGRKRFRLHSAIPYDEALERYPEVVRAYAEWAHVLWDWLLDHGEDAMSLASFFDLPPSLIARAMAISALGDREFVFLRPIVGRSSTALRVTIIGLDSEEPAIDDVQLDPELAAGFMAGATVTAEYVRRWFGFQEMQRLLAARRPLRVVAPCATFVVLYDDRLDEMFSYDVIGAIKVSNNQEMARAILEDDTLEIEE